MIANIANIENKALEIVKEKIFQKQNPRELAKIEGDRIIINEDDLNLFDYFDRESIPDWQPKTNLKPYADLKSFFIDIETDGGVYKNDNLEVIDKKINEGILDEVKIFEELFKREPNDKDKFIISCIKKYIKGTIKDIDEMLLDYGVNPIDHRIVLIGLMNNKGFPLVINCTNHKINSKKVREALLNNADTQEQIKKLLSENKQKKVDEILETIESLLIINSGSEKQGLEDLIEILETKNPEVITGFNCFKFDLPFIIKRCEHLKVKHPFWIKFSKKTCHKTAQRFGSPALYNTIKFNRKDRKECAIIDLYNQVLSWDYVARKLTSYSLKQSVLQTGLRKTQRTELSFPEMLDCINQGKLDLLTEYLVYDLEDTKLLGDFLIPSIYYQQLFLPDWGLQSLSHSGNGSKWNDILKKYYMAKGIKEEDLPKTDEKKVYTGGLTGANAGVYLNVSKIDVASLYPNIMLTYGICCYKDDDKFMLQILNYLLKWRLSLKAKKNEGTATNEEKRTEGAFKVIINSGYGKEGCGGINYNDYVSAALVTAYGRGILKLIIKHIILNGGTIASIDTDGVYYSTTDNTFKLNADIHKAVQSAMPKGIKLDYELEAKLFYVPPKAAKKLKATEELEENVTEGIVNDGLKKNYIIIGWKNPKDKDNSPLVIKCKGKFVKRDRCKLEKEFQPQFLLRYAEKDLQEAQKYYQNIIDELNLGIYNLDNLKITRKIRIGEKKICAYGKAGDVVSYYRGIDTPTYHKKTGKLNKTVIENWVIEGEIGKDYYIKLVNSMYQEIMKFI